MRDRHSVDKNITTASLFLTSFEIHQKDRVVDKIKSKRDVILQLLTKAFLAVEAEKAFQNVGIYVNVPKNSSPNQ